MSVASPRIIKSFDNLLERFNYIISLDAPLTSHEEIKQTYNDGTLKSDLKFKTVSLTETQAKNLAHSITIEEDFIVKAETIDHNQFLYNFIGEETELYEEENINTSKTEGYTWNIPFVNGTEEDLSTLGSQDIKVGVLDSGIAMGKEFENVYRVDLVPNTLQDFLGIHHDVTGHGTNSAGIIAAAALILSADNTKTPEFVKQLLVSTANISVSQKGILDIKNALEVLPQFEEFESITPSQIPENTEEIEEFEISEDVVVGNWSKQKHANLIYKFTYPETSSGEDVYTDVLEDIEGEMGELGTLCQTKYKVSKKNIMLFARAAYIADYFYDFNAMKKFAPLHAVGFTSGVNSNSRKTGNGGSMNSNYVADTKYLYRLARHYFSSDTVAAAHASIDDVTQAGGTNVEILQAIVKGTQVLRTIPADEISGPEAKIEVKGIVRMSIIDGYDESKPDNAGWKILGLAAHLAADAYAHRTRVPLSSVNAGKWFHSTTAPNCFRGDNHIMNNTGARTPDQTKLKKLLKEQSTYQTQYVTNGDLCQCYDCLRTAISGGYVEFRDISGKYVYDDEDTYDDYNIDSSAVYPQRYNIGTKHAVKKLTTQFAEGKDFTIFVFLPSDSTGYTLKLNGLEDYIEGTGTNMENLADSTIILIEKYSTSAII